MMMSYLTAAGCEDVGVCVKLTAIVPRHIKLISNLTWLTSGSISENGGVDYNRELVISARKQRRVPSGNKESAFF
jgi:hypothetical protein